MNFRLITVGIADMQIANPPDILRTILGSCVGICLYDKINLVGGLAHIMLPTKKQANSDGNKYADSAIPLLLGRMYQNGAEKIFISAKIVGGATMFKMSQNNPTGNIGQMNIESVQNVLKEQKIPIVGEELGGDCGRTIDFFMDTGAVKIRCLNKEIKVL